MNASLIDQRGIFDDNRSMSMEPFSLGSFSFPASPDPNRFVRRLEELRASLHQKSPIELAKLTGADWLPEDGTKGEFLLDLWGKTVRLIYPQWELFHLFPARLATPMENTLLLYYFNLADGAPMVGSWISFSELPDGKFYNQAFQGYTGVELGRCFGDDLEAFKNAARLLDGEPIDQGDVGFRFLALPRIPLAVAYWQGDEDFPSSAQVLFDHSAGHYLTTDSFAILGSTLTRRLIAAKA